MHCCPYCGSETPASYNFCVHCERQVQCTNPDCHALLVPGKSRCLLCGKLVVGDDVASPNANRLVRNVTANGNSYTERIEIYASDAALGQFAPMLVGGAVRQKSQNPSVSVNNQLLQQSLPFDESEPVSEQHDVVDEGHHEAVFREGESRRDVALELFEVEGETLVPRVRTFKGSTKKECQARLVVMFTWAYREIFGQTTPSRDVYNKVAVRIGLYDPNWRKYFSRTVAEYLNPAGRGYALSANGERKVETILSDMADDSVFGYEVAQPAA